METEVHILVAGNPMDGFTIVGPFECADDAMAYGDHLCVDWWATTMHAPEED